MRRELTRAWRNLMLVGSVALMAVLACSLLAGCAPQTRYYPVETVRKEYVNADTTALSQLISLLREQLHSKERTIDSLMQSHKERLVLNDKGDTLRHDTEHTVYRYSSREKELERELLMRDSVIERLRTELSSIKADSIPVPYPVPYPVEKKLTRWEQAKLDVGGMAIGGFALALCIAVVWLIKKFRK